MYHLRHTSPHTYKNGFTVMEVMVAITIFGMVAAAIFQLLMQVDRIRGRAWFVESAVRIAANEAEQLGTRTATDAPIADSSYTVAAGGRQFFVERRVIDVNKSPSFIPRPLEPTPVEIIITDPLVESPITQPLRFRLLLGEDTP
jgi:prepilin-type N-terminal cleavage/methylation domain-containing protein